LLIRSCASPMYLLTVLRMSASRTIAMITPYVGGVGWVGSCSLHSNTLQTPYGSVRGMATSPEQLVVNDIVYELNRHGKWFVNNHGTVMGGGGTPDRSEEHTSELQSRFELVCRLLLEKKKDNKDEDAG